MKTRIVHTKIWEDDYFVSLDANGKLLFMYLITNSRVNMVWTYEISVRQMSFDTGLVPEKVTKLLEKFKNDKKILFTMGWVHLCNAHKYETYSGELNERSKNKILAQIPLEVLSQCKAILDTPIDTPINTPLIPSINNKEEIINNNTKKGGVGENKKEDLDKLLFLKYVDAWNEVTGSRRILTPELETALKRKTQTYDMDSIIQGMKNMLATPYWKSLKDPITPLRSRNKNGECDYIGQYLDGPQIEKDAENLRKKVKQL